MDVASGSENVESAFFLMPRSGRHMWLHKAVWFYRSLWEDVPTSYLIYDFSKHVSVSIATCKSHSRQDYVYFVNEALIVYVRIINY